MDRRIIKIEFDDSEYNNDGVDILLKVSSSENTNDFITMSTYSYSCKGYSSWDEGEGKIEKCFKQFKEVLEN